ncbi:type II secretion system major pseudopilin GspG [Flocculibacter collagenilyticus]|uniref:type II secretion system major pseudopilin GspG n=1 Tax=Flocculibacter collagenilyticus TaxID=2744479 RepID=UPI0018F7CB0B|nr:type II secretion system major pseudopilin GspG [Flocculibacter collagenilyticus]
MKIKNTTYSPKTVSGFTLLEVMVVLVILGIIASLVVPNLLGETESAKLKKAAIDVQNIENVLKMYKLKNGFYPSTEQGLEALVEKSEVEPVPRNFPAEGFISRLPKDPWNNDYQLLSPGEMGVIDIFSMGADGQAGTDDDIGNWNLDEVLGN